MNKVLQRAAVLIALCLVGMVARADTAADEIDHLIEAIGASGCTFVRNGKSHSVNEAEAHLRMKYSRAKRHAKRTEQFITRLASKSSLTGRPYYMHCDDNEPEKAGDWLNRRLEAFREG